MLRFSLSLIVALGALLTQPAHAGPLEHAEAETRRVLTRSESGEPLCFPDIKGPADAHVIYTYGGGDLVDPSLTAHPPRYADVRVEPTDRPVLLVLSAYEPIAWRIDSAPEARIAGVYLSGYYEQMVLGLPDGVPVGRSMYRLRSGDGTERCASVGDKKGIEEAAVSRERFKELSRKRHALSREVEKSRYRVTSLRDIRSELEKEDNAQAAAPVIDRMIQETQAQMTQMRQDGHRLEAELRRLATGMSSAGTGSEGKAFGFDKATYFKSPSRVAALGKALAERGDIRIASYQQRTRKGGPSFTVSDDAAAAYAELRAAGAKGLAELTLPELPYVETGAPRLTAPQEKIAGDGVRYLIEKDYLANSAEADRYICEKRRFTRMAQGIADATKCTPSRNSRSVTILGPIVFPAGLCGGHSVTFLLPPGVPEPEGSSCHSRVIPLDEPPCIEESSECFMREVRR